MKTLIAFIVAVFGSTAPSSPAAYLVADATWSASQQAGHFQEVRDDSKRSLRGRCDPESRRDSLSCRDEVRKSFKRSPARFLLVYPFGQVVIVHGASAIEFEVCRSACFSVSCAPGDLRGGRRNLFSLIRRCGYVDRQSQ